MKIQQSIRKVLTGFFFLMLKSAFLLGQNISIDTIKIKPYLSLYYGADYKYLGLTTIPSEVSTIKNFEFCWGKEFMVEVEKTTLNNSRSDQANRSFTLRKILEEKVCTQECVFTLRLENQKYLGPGIRESTLVKFSKDRYLYFAEIMIVVPRHLGKSFQRIISENKNATGEFIPHEEFIELKNLQFDE